jgi:hypothetical protein
MNIFWLVVSLLAVYGLYHLAIKVWGEKEVDDEITTLEAKAEAEAKKVL